MGNDLTHAEKRMWRAVYKAAVTAGNPRPAFEADRAITAMRERGL